MQTLNTHVAMLMLLFLFMKVDGQSQNISSRSHIKFQYIGDNDKPITTIVFNLHGYDSTVIKFGFMYNISLSEFNDLSNQIKDRNYSKIDLNKAFYQIVIFNGDASIYYVSNIKFLEQLYNSVKKTLEKNRKIFHINKIIDQIILRLKE